MKTKKMTGFKLGISAFFLFFSVVAFAQPGNDLCSGATTVTPDGSCTAGTTVAGNDNWTGTVGCAGNNNEVWYSFTASETALAINLSAGTMGDDLEFILAEPSGAPCTSSFYIIGSSCGPSILIDTLTGIVPGITYYFTISGGSDGTFTVCVDEFTPPANPGQDCGNANILCDESGFTIGTVASGAGSIFGNGSEEDMSAIASCFGGDERQSQWYTFTAGQSGTIEFNINPANSNDDYDWVLYDITASGCNLNSGAAVEIDCNWSGCKGSTGISSDINNEPGVNSSGAGCFGNPAAWEAAGATLTAGNTYVLLIDNFSISNTGFSFIWGGNSGGMTAVIGPDAAFTATSSCSNNDATGTATNNVPNTTYEWFWGDGNSTLGTFQETHTYTTAGTYIITLVVTDALGCTKTSSFTVDVGSGPQSTISPDPAAICPGGTISMDGNPSAGSGTFTTHAWTGSTGPLSSTSVQAPNFSTTAPGTYTLTYTVTDDLGCTGSDDISVVVNPAPSLTMDSTDVTCNGDGDGTATVTPSGANSPYTFLWDPSASAQTNATATGLDGGSFTVTVTDANLCSASGSVTVIEPTVLSVVMDSTDLACNGDGDGTAIATPAGGDSPYNYLWSVNAGSQTNSTATGLNGGSFSVTVTDASSCTVNGSVVVNEPAALSLTMDSTDVTCNGDGDGTATVTVGGGSSPYGYLWDATAGSQTNATATGLGGGTFSVTVTDVNLCTVNSSVTVVEPPVLTATMDSADVSCGGAGDGTATANPAGGSTPYSYLWDVAAGSQTTQTATGLSGSSFNVTVTDANSCTFNGSVTVIEPTLLSVVMDSTDVSCNGVADGDATATASGGTTPYSYLWEASAGSQTNATATGLGGGNYSVTVTDGSLCSVTDSIVVNEPALFSLSLDSTNVSCNGVGDGTATANASGGTTAYTYLWDATASSQTSATATGLSGGNYSVTVTDANSCSVNNSITVNEPSAIQLSMDSTDVSCNGAADGTATVNVVGGSSPYNYLWEASAGSQTSSVATGLNGGIYTVTVTDAVSCTLEDSVEVVENSAISTVMSSNPAGCGGFDGDASVAASGGTGSLTYLWDTNASSQTTFSATGLAYGTFVVTVTDSLGCTNIDSAQVGQTGTAPVVLSTQSDILCNGDSTGAVDLTVFGVDSMTLITVADSYVDSNNTGSNFGTLTSLQVEPMCLWPTPMCGNEKETYLRFDLSALPAGVSVDSVTLESTAFDGFAWGNDGNVYTNFVADDTWGETTITWNNRPPVSGGTLGFWWLWYAAPGIQVGQNSSPLLAAQVATEYSGDQQISLRLNSPGYDTEYYSREWGTVSQRPNLKVYYSSLHTFSWTGPNGFTASTEDISGIAAGTYNVTVTDPGGCVWDSTFVISQPSAMTSVPDSTDVLCNGDGNGAATVTLSGGTTPYGYVWDASTGNQTTSTATGLSGGSYAVVYTDGNSCMDSTVVTVIEPAVLTLTTDSSDVSCFGLSDGSATVTPAGGTVGYTYLWDSSTGSQTNSSATGLDGGTYSVTVTDGALCQTNTTVTVNEPSALSVTMDSTDVSCSGISDGSATAIVSGGTSTYSYLWDANTGSQTSSTATALSGGVYVVTVSDQNTCLIVDSVEVLENGALTLSTIETDVSCFGSIDGSSTVSALGGVTPYSYIWEVSTGSQTTGTATGLGQGIYTVTVSDVNGCTDSISSTITEPAGLSLIMSSTNENCTGDSTGSATVAVSGGSGSISYLWDANTSSQTSSTSTGLGFGLYHVTVTDSVGCNATDSVQINSPLALSLNVSVSDASCGGASDGNATVAVSGGSGSYTYQWDNATGNQTTANATGLSAGNYSVIVNDSLGCSDSLIATINEPSVLSLVMSASDVSCNGAGDGSISTVVSGGSGNYSWTWDSGTGNQTDTSATGLNAGTYILTVTDSSGCSVIDSSVVNEPNSITHSFVVVNPGCSGGNDGSASVTAAGGSGGLSYLWSVNTSSQTTPNATGLAAGLYSLTITDSLGCTISDSVNLIDPASLTVNVSSSNAKCGLPNGSLTASVIGGTSPFSYTWSDGQVNATAVGLSAGTYSLTVTDVAGCTVINGIVVGGSVTPISLTISSTDAICYGGSEGTASALASGMASPYVITWDNGQVGASATGLTAGTHLAILTDIDACQDSVFFTISEPPVFLVDFTTTNEMCDGVNGSASALASGGNPGYNYNWDDSGNSTTLSINGLSSGSYYLTVTDSQNCTLMDSVNIVDASDASVLVSSHINSGYAPLHVNFSNNNPTGTYLWEFGDDSTSALASPFHVFSSPGEYLVMLTYTAASGCVAQDSLTIYVDGNSSLIFPNVFSPNNDGVNDFLHFNAQFMTDFNVMIVDRWGMRVFEWSEPEFLWDGRNYSGNPIPQGVYYFILNATGIDGTIYKHKGAVTLIR